MIPHLFSLPDINTLAVALGSVLLGSTAGAMGCFAFLRKRALIGDALAHAALPGVVLGFVISGGKTQLALLSGALLTAWLGARAIDGITRHSKIKEDTATAVSLSVLFALGIVGLTIVQKTGSAAQSGLSHFLFGNAASLMMADVVHFAWLALLCWTLLLVLFKELKVVAFDSHFAQAAGLPIAWLDFALTTLIVVAVVVGLQAVGVVLMAAMLITPPAAARLWTDRLSVMILVSAGLGALSGLLGAYLSTLAPRMPTGPWMVMAATVVFGISLFLAPRRGLLARARHFLRLQRTTLEEHVLKAFYHVGEQHAGWGVPVQEAELARTRAFAGNSLRRGLRRLQRHGWIMRSENGFALTTEGQARATRVVRLHRLWELYLSQYMQLPADHVHRDAELMEHILTPELEAQLEATLQRPHVDPHGEPIPYTVPRPA